MAAVSSLEADQVTPLMSKIYLRIVNAPEKYWEREGVLRIEAEMKDEKMVKAWTVLCNLVGVASATASKALAWMHEQGIIGYFSGKNGVGLRIFLNRATSSIGVRTVSDRKNFLPFSPASRGEPHASPNEPAFNDSFAVLDDLELSLNPRAQKNGADKKPIANLAVKPMPTFNQTLRATHNAGNHLRDDSIATRTATVDELITRLKIELEPSMSRTAAQAAAHEMAQTRKWFEERALPKAVRIAQHETYDLLRKLGALDERKERTPADLQVGLAAGDPIPASTIKPLTPGEITEVAETCVALLETQGKKIEVTLAGIASGEGGWLLPGDAPKVRAEAEKLLRAREEEK